MGSRPPVAGPRHVSGLSPHDLGTKPQKASSIWVVLAPFHFAEVVNKPTPTLTRPSPKGKIQP